MKLDTQTVVNHDCASTSMNGFFILPSNGAKLLRIVPGCQSLTQCDSAEDTAEQLSIAFFLVTYSVANLEVRGRDDRQGMLRKWFDQNIITELTAELC